MMHENKDKLRTAIVAGRKNEEITDREIRRSRRPCNERYVFICTSPDPAPLEFVLQCVSEAGGFEYNVIGNNYN